MRDPADGSAVMLYDRSRPRGPSIAVRNTRRRMLTHPPALPLPGAGFEHPRPLAARPSAEGCPYTMPHESSAAWQNLLQATLAERL